MFSLDDEFRPTQSAVEYKPMSARDNETHKLELESRLRELDARFAEEMRKRGFDPAQADNIALPSALARLYTEREAVKAELEEIIAGDQTGG